MDMNFDSYLIPIIAVGCLCIGFVLKKWMPADDKWIPTILLILGGVAGAILLGTNIESIVKGMLSGLASVGLHQAFHQHFKLDTFGEMTEAEANETIEEFELGEDEDGEV